MNESAKPRALGPDEVPEVVSVLAEAFFDYPVMRFVLEPGPEYATRLEHLVTFFVMVRVLRGEVLLGVGRPGVLRAAALVSRPKATAGSPELSALREDTWARLGSEARARYASFGAATAPFVVAEEHIHLNMIGVRRAAQGLGLGRTLLEAVHELSAGDPSSNGVSLTTEAESNVPLYRHFGYQVIGSAEVGTAFTTWTMYRRDG